MTRMVGREEKLRGFQLGLLQVVHPLFVGHAFDLLRDGVFDASEGFHGVKVLFCSSSGLHGLLGR